MVVVVRLSDNKIIYKHMDDKASQRSFGKCEIGDPSQTKHIRVPNDLKDRILKVKDGDVVVDIVAEYNQLPWYKKMVTATPEE